MSARAPAIPTPKQIRDVHQTVAKLCPGARLTRVGPEGVSFEHPGSPAVSTSPADDQWAGKPFSDRT